MMTITQTKTGSTLTVALTGRLDTTTAPELEALVKSDLTDVTALNFDFTDLEYVSSAGLRVLLTAQKTMKTRGSMVVKHCNESVMEVFELTGFSDILTLEK